MVASSRDTLFIVRGETFTSKAALERRVKQELDQMPLNRVVVNPFLQAVVNNYHSGLITAGMCSTGEFEYLDHSEQARRGLDTAIRFRGGKLMTTRILPLGEMRDCTVYPWRKQDRPNDQSIIGALRHKAAYFLPRPQSSDRCAVEGCPARGGALEYNHVLPTFRSIAIECLALMARSDIDNLFGYNKFTPGRDDLVHCIPDDHPAIRRLRDLHDGNEWEWLCAFHHRGVQRAEPAQFVLEFE